MVDPIGGRDLPVAVTVGPGSETDFTLYPKLMELLLKVLREENLGLRIQTAILDAGHDAAAIFDFNHSRRIDSVIDRRDDDEHAAAAPPAAAPPPVPPPQKTAAPGEPSAAAHGDAQPADSPPPVPTPQETAAPGEPPAAGKPQNKKKRKPKVTTHIFRTTGGQEAIFTADGYPLCQAGAIMKRFNYDASRDVINFCCPAKCETRVGGKSAYAFHPERCPQGVPCHAGTVAPIVSVKCSLDPQTFCKFLPGSREFIRLMKLRTAVERSFSTIKEQFHLNRAFRTKAYFHIASALISMLEHALAWNKELEQTGVDFRKEIFCAADENLAGAAPPS